MMGLGLLQICFISVNPTPRLGFATLNQPRIVGFCWNLVLCGALHCSVEVAAVLNL